ncbi:MAG: tetratricopeptide repeat protein [Candidatus Omnitrophica bacterium]|nr:tetratricopeptide repeat protein [Candidatus Omnitrophota bacterium]
MADETGNIKKEKPSLPAEVEQHYQKGVAALEKRNYEYALFSFNQALALYPDFPDCRHCLRITERRMWDENPRSGAGKFLLKIKLLLPLVIGTIQKSSGKTITAINTCEKILAKDPYNASAMNNLADIMLKEGMKESALKTLEELVETGMADTEAFRKLAVLYKDKGEYPKSQACYKRILSVKPHDHDAHNGIKNLDALMTIHRGKWEKQETFRDAIKDQKETVKLEKGEKIVRTEADTDFFIKENEEKLQQNPQDITILRTLGDLYLRKNDFTTARDRYEKALKSDPGNLALQRKIADANIKELEKNVSSLQEILAKKPDDEITKKKMEILQSGLEKLKLDELKSRVAQYPSDLGLRFEYGVMLKKYGQIDKAIGEFQLAVNDLTKRNQALNLLGLCFKEKKMYDLAVAQFQKALAKTKGLDEEVKEIIYNLGETFEAMGEINRAVEEYKKIYEVDINYRDISRKMEQAYNQKN